MTNVLIAERPAPFERNLDLTGERDRFLALFDQLFAHTLDYVGRATEAAYAAIPVDSPVMFLGTRVNKITIGGLLRHLILAEAHWFERLAKAAAAEVIPFPDNAAILEGVPNGAPLIERYRETYAQARVYVAELSNGDLQKIVTFAGRSYTGLGLLWSIHGHHGFHVGQIDMLLRQQGIEPPEYMEWPNSQGVVG